MTRTHRRLALSALLLTFGAAAWAQEVKQGPAELLPAPRRYCGKPQCPEAPCCADKIGCPGAPCCDKAICCPACAKPCHATKQSKTREHAKRKQVTRMYSVLDLLPPEYGPARENRGGTMEEVLIRLITNAVAPQSWANMGGPGTIDFYPLGMAVVVNQPRGIQKQVAKFLDALRQYCAAWDGEDCQAAGPRPVPPSCPVPFADPRLPAVYPVPVMVEASPAPAGQVGPLPPVRMAVPVVPPPPCCAPEACPPPPPANVYAPPPCPPPLPFVQAMAPESKKAASHACRMRVITEEGKEKLEIRSDCGVLTCEGLEMKAPGCGRFKLSTVRTPSQVTGTSCDGSSGTQLSACAVSKQVQITGPALTATADSVAGAGKPGCLVLEGHVQLKYQKAGQRAEVMAEHVLVGLADGRLEIEPRNAGTSSVKSPEPVSLTNFSFWTGFFK